MITNLKIKNFKSLLNTDVSFSNINILSGINGLGKSTLIQVLLLLRQSFRKNLFPKRGLLLNGDLISLGKGKDVLNIATEEKEISFTINFDDYETLTAHFEFVQDSDFLPLLGEKSEIDIGTFEHQLFNNREAVK